MKRGTKVMAKLAPWMIILAGCIWGGFGIFVRYLRSMDIASMTIVEIRYAGAFLMMFIGTSIYKRELLRVKFQDLWCFIGAGVFIGVFMNYFYNAAVEYVSLSLAAVLLCTAPFFVIFLAAGIFKERITSVKVISLLLAFGGCVLTSGYLEGSAFFSLQGFLNGLGSGIAYALATMFSRVAINRGYQVLTISAYSFFFGFVGCLPFADFGPVVAQLNQNPLFFSVFLLFHSLVALVVPSFLMTAGMQYVDTGRASILVSCEPVAATIFGIAIYNEIPSVLVVIGIILVVLALTILNVPDNFVGFLKIKASRFFG